MVIFGEYNTSVKRAFEEIDKNWQKYNGVVICGTHNPDDYDIEDLIDKIKWTREFGIRLYGECWGYQLCAIEYARNVLGIKDATSEEWGKGTFVVKKRKEGLNVGWHDGESYWNNYIVDLPNWEISNNFFIAQYHASYQSSLLSPHQLIVKFLQYAKMAM